MVLNFACKHDKYVKKIYPVITAVFDALNSSNNDEVTSIRHQVFSLMTKVRL